MTSEGQGEIGKDGNVLLVKRIHVTYHLKLSFDQREMAERVHSFHADFCPVAHSIRNCINISTSLEMEQD